MSIQLGNPALSSENRVALELSRCLMLTKPIFGNIEIKDKWVPGPSEVKNTERQHSTKRYTTWFHPLIKGFHQPVFFSAHLYGPRSLRSFGRIKSVCPHKEISVPRTTHTQNPVQVRSTSRSQTFCFQRRGCPEVTKKSFPPVSDFMPSDWSSSLCWNQGAEQSAFRPTL